ncbi:MAG TPA: helix-turn-helix domain-containing protein [Dermatophilaceae bacterium]|mgnify:CR=1 FL=1|jgi:hypothetical protein|nr:helix-turn-helix domain-containing protein [Dermatophilaceae bacterium]
MTYRVTVVGRAFFRGDAQDRADALAEVIDAIDRTGGNVCRAAHEVGLSRWQLYRIVRAANLWPVIDAARLAWVERNMRREPDWLAATRKNLR